MERFKKIIELIFEYRRFLYNLIVAFLLLNNARQQGVTWYALLEVLVSAPLAIDFLRHAFEQLKGSTPKDESIEEIDHGEE